MDYLELTRDIKITQLPNGKSNGFWREVRIDDVIRISTEVHSIGRDCQVFELLNVRSNKKSYTTGGLLAQKLRKLEYKYVSE